MVYVLSDLHGDDKRYEAFVTEKLQDDDTAYILGDAIDRQTGGIKIIRDIMKRPNVHLILGNHEYMMMKALSEEAIHGDRITWWSNGGIDTEVEYRKQLPEEQKQILEFLDSCPDHVDLCVSGRKFHLVHAWPADNTYDRIWLRRYWFEKNPIPGTTVIIGHTVTIQIPNNFRDAMNGEHICIYPKPEDRGRLELGYIAIDCGCGHPVPSRLAVLRLDDMAEFYY